MKPKKNSFPQLHLLLLHSFISFVSKTLMVLGLNCGKSAFVIVIYLIAAASPLHLATLLPQSSEKWPWAWLMRRAPAHKWVLSHKRERVLHENSIYCWPPLHLLLMNLRPLCTHKLVGYNNLPDFTLAYFVCKIGRIYWYKNDSVW